MEGGTEHDLRILEQPVEEEEERERLMSGGPPSENQKREENRGTEGDRKASTEQDEKEVRLLHQPISPHLTRLSFVNQEVHYHTHTHSDTVH